MKKLDLPGVDFVAAKQVVKDVVAAIEQRQLGYAIVTATKPELPLHFQRTRVSAVTWFASLDVILHNVPAY